MTLDVSLDSIDLLERSQRSNFASGETKLADREDSQTIVKTKNAVIDSPSFESKKLASDASDRSLNGRVSLGAPTQMEEKEAIDEIVPLEPITMDHPAMHPQLIQAIDAELARIQELPQDGSSEEGNFLIKMREVVAKILIQFNQISERDRVQMDKMKKDYSQSTHQAADLQRSIGNAGLYIAVIGFGVLLSQFGFSNPADREVMKFLSEQTTPNIGGMFTGRYQGNMKEADALAQLLLAEYNAKTSKTQSESNSKQEIISLLDKVLESMKRASMAN